MKATAHFLIPFDLGLELDFAGPDAKAAEKEISTRSSAPVSFEGRSFSDAQVTTTLFRFGIGLTQLSFPVEGDLGALAALACKNESLSVGKTRLETWARALVDGQIAKARKFAEHAYDRRLEDFDVFPVFLLDRQDLGGAEAFFKANVKAFYGIVSGEPRYESLSDFVLGAEKIVNFGYYEDELILIKRFGAVIASAEAGTILNLIRLAYATHWNLRSYNFLLGKEVDETRSLLSHLPPYYKFWLMPQSYQRFSQEAIAFGKDKLAIVDSLYNVSASVPIESDWHLRTVYKNVEKEFDIDDLSRAVEAKLDRIESSYNSARDFLSTNFFIAVEIVLILSLAWMVMDTTLLFVIANK